MFIINEMKNIFITTTILAFGLNVSAQKVSILSGSSFVQNLKELSSIPQNAIEKIEKKSFEGSLPVTNKKNNTGNNLTTFDFTEQIIKPNKDNPNSIEQIGIINYTQGFYEATGKVWFNDKHLAKGKDYAIEMATLGAEVDARANLLTMILAVEIYDTVRVIDKMVEQKVTIQTIHGYVKANIVDKLVGENFVSVVARTSADNVYEFAQKQNFLPISEVSEYTEKEKQEALSQYLRVLKEEKIVSDTTSIVPPLVVSVPQQQAANFNPTLVPNIKIQCGEKEFNLDMTKFYNKNNSKALTIINAVGEKINASALLDKVPVIDGAIKNGSLDIDLCSLAKKQERSKQILAVLFDKIGPKVLKMALSQVPVVGMFTSLL
jgi:hypothetical protein